MAPNFADLNVKECRHVIHVWPKTDQVIGRALQDCGEFAEGGNLAMVRYRSSPFCKNAIAIGIFRISFAPTIFVPIRRMSFPSGREQPQDLPEIAAPQKDWTKPIRHFIRTAKSRCLSPTQSFGGGCRARIERYCQSQVSPTFCDQPFLNSM